MGLHESWIVVQDTSIESLQMLFDPGKGKWRNDITFRELPGGWGVVHHRRNGFHGREELIAASRLNFALRLDLYDNGPFHSILTAAEYGQILWEVAVDDDEKLVIEGRPPLDEAALRKLVGDGTDGGFGDDYEIPPALLETLTGFSYFSWFPIHVLPPPPPPLPEPTSLWSKGARIYKAWGNKELRGPGGHVAALAYFGFHFGVLTAIILLGRWLFHLARMFLP